MPTVNLTSFYLDIVERDGERLLDPGDVVKDVLLLGDGLDLVLPVGGHLADVEHDLAAEGEPAEVAEHYRATSVRNNRDWVSMSIH